MTKTMGYRLLLLMVSLSLFCLSCVPKPPENDVALIKELLVKFEKGLRENDVKALRSVINKKQTNLASKLITDLSAGGEIKTIYIASKRFTIVKDSAKVELEFKMKGTEGGNQSEEFQKPTNLFLNKQKGKWRIETYQIMKPAQ